jgi:hypothetical protein
MWKVLTCKILKTPAFIAVLLIACSSPKTEIPDEIINPELMTDILVDIKIYDAAFQLGIVGEVRQSAVSLDSFENPVMFSKSFREEFKARLKRDTFIGKSELDTFNYSVIQSDVHDTTLIEQIAPHLGADYEIIFKKHKVSKKDFEVSFEYYAERPGLLDAILTDVINKLIIQQSYLEKETLE